MGDVASHKSGKRDALALVGALKNPAVKRFLRQAPSDEFAETSVRYDSARNPCAICSA